MGKKVGFWSQVALTFFIVSGGPFGLEGSVGALGPAVCFALILIVPFVWAIPTSLVVAELSAMMPQRGGYYIWVQRALGPFWGFQEGWWTLCFSAVDLAIYPVLFVTYLSFFFPLLNLPTAGSMFLRWVAGAAFVFCSLLLNLRGSYKVGRFALVQIVAVSVPFFILVVAGLFWGNWSLLSTAFSAPHLTSIAPTQWAAGLAIIVWNYAGWDNVSTYADEVHHPEKMIPKSLAVTLLLVFLSYALPLLAGFTASTQGAVWSDSSGWPQIAELLLGTRHGWPLGLWLGTLTAFVALLSAWALFNSQLLYISRLPITMAEDGYLPSRFRQVSAKTGTPTFSLFCAAFVAVIFCGFSLGKLMIIDVLLYFLGLSLEFVALIVLRRTEPHAPRPFRIPLSITGLVLMSLVPLLIALIVAVSSVLGSDGSLLQVGIVVAVILIGFPLYSLIRQKQSIALLFASSKAFAYKKRHVVVKQDPPAC